jgi:hypothetical protein
MVTKDYSQLTPWSKGQSGNPAGRPKEPLTILLREYLEANNGERKQELIDHMYQLAISDKRGNVPALIEIFNRIDGKLIDRSMSLSVSVTPEMLEQAQQALLMSQNESKLLLAEYKEG